MDCVASLAMTKLRVGATNQLDGQINQNLSIPSRKNIPLKLSGKSVI